MTDRQILNELRLTLEFLERQALNADCGEYTPAFGAEAHERATGLRPVVKAMEDKVGR